MDVQIGRAIADLRVRCVMSVSRLMFSDNVLALTQTLTAMKVHPTITQGAFWDQCLEGGIEDNLDSDVILFVDHDSVFRSATVEALLALLLTSGYDAIAPLQSKRMANTVMLTQAGWTPDQQCTVKDEWFDEPVQPVETAHFGCTVVKTSAIKACPKPWFKSHPAEDGGWRGPHVDCDIHFWDNFKASGFRLGVATGISIGHAELMVSWPSLKSRTGKVFGYPQEFWGGSAPPEAHGVLQ